MSTCTTDQIHLLASINENYVRQLCALLVSVHTSNPQESFVLHLLYRELSDEALGRLQATAQALGMRLNPIHMDDEPFANAPQSQRYPHEMYYRLLAPKVLPGDLDRVIYLDPDMLVLNSLRPLWELDLKGNAFAAASHTSDSVSVDTVNRLRLSSESSYVNSGLLLIDVPAARELVNNEELFAYVEKHGDMLLLPDQDVLNALYGSSILEIDDAIWNYDARHYRIYRLKSEGVADTEWVINNTVVMHFCGRPKPWEKSYPWRFGTLYRHYLRLADLIYQAPERNNPVLRLPEEEAAQ